jgi:hypothetical protein
MAKKESEKDTIPARSLAADDNLTRWSIAGLYGN